MDKLDDEQKKEFFDYIYKKEYKGKNSHDEPSPETRERLKGLEVNQQNFMDKLEENQITNEKAHEALMGSMKEFHLTTNASLKEMTEKLDIALSKKADKIIVDRIETNVADLQGTFKWVAYTVIGAVILGVIGFVFFK